MGDASRTEGGRVGLTGGIATGKSTAGRLFRNLGIPVVDADQVARDVVAPGSPGIEAVVQAFGPAVRLPDGRLDRAALAQLTFGDRQNRARLESILHPLIAAEAWRRLDAALARGTAPYALYEAALLVETGFYRALDALIVVTAPAGVQRARLGRRDGLAPEQVEQRLAAQATEADKCALADYVIRNDGDVQALAEEVGKVDAALRARFGALGWKR